MRILVCGNRTCVGPGWFECVGEWLSAVDRAIRVRGESVVLVHGAQTTRERDGRLGGADYFAGVHGERLGWSIEAHPVTHAEWEKLGAKAGPLRNERMADSGVDRAIAFGYVRKGGRYYDKRTGTGGMVDMLNERNVLVTLVAAPWLRPG